MLPSIAPRLAFVDVETTGSSPERERVTEVGLVVVDIDGDDARVTEWSSLVNPGIPIPADIQWLTGITNDMVRGAPAFAELAQELYDRLEGAIFVAHNARFDYGFLRAEFGRAGLNFHARTLCTVRLSRHLYPDRAPHTLDAIIERFGLGGEQRHRALGDARVLWRLLQKLADRHPPAELELAVAALLRHPSLPSHLPPDALDALPHAPGVYLFYGLNEHPIYIGKSVDLRARVSGHFNAEHRAPRELRLSQEVHRLEWEETAGELGALLREGELIKSRLPAHNIALRRKLNQVMLELDDDGRPRYRPATTLPLDAFGWRVRAVRFASRRAAGAERTRRRTRPVHEGAATRGTTAIGRGCAVFPPAVAPLCGRLRWRGNARRPCAAPARAAGAVVDSSLAAPGRGRAGRASRRPVARRHPRLRSLVLARDGQDTGRRRGPGSQRPAGLRGRRRPPGLAGTCRAVRD